MDTLKNEQKQSKIRVMCRRGQFSQSFLQVVIQNKNITLFLQELREQSNYCFHFSQTEQYKNKNKNNNNKKAHQNTGKKMLLDVYINRAIILHYISQNHLIGKIPLKAIQAYPPAMNRDTYSSTSVLECLLSFHLKPFLLVLS